MSRREYLGKATQAGALKFNIRKTFFIVGMVRHKLVRDASSLEKFKFKLNRALDNLIWWKLWIELHLGRSLSTQIIL